MKAKRISKALHDAGTTLVNPKATKRDKELAAKVLSDQAKKKD